jgi:hypothetical protein
MAPARSSAPPGPATPVATLVAAPGVGAVPQTVTLTVAPEADARVEAARPDANDGAAPRLQVDGGADPAVESHLRFRVAGVDGRVVARATLRLFALTGTADGPAVSTAADPAWAEAAITWRTRPSRASAPVADAGAIAAGTWVELDVTPLVGGDGADGFVLATASADGVAFASREAAGQRPALVLIVVADGTPAPPSRG